MEFRSRLGNRQLGAEHRAARAGEEAGLEQQRVDRCLGDSLPVEALDRKTLCAALLHIRDVRRERWAQPFVRGLAQRH